MSLDVGVEAGDLTTELYIQRFNGDQADERIREAMSGGLEPFGTST
jgi:hypothetical protein